MCVLTQWLHSVLHTWCTYGTTSGHYNLVVIWLSIQDGRTPLMVASYNGHVDVVHILIEAHTNIELQDKVSTSLYNQLPHCVWWQWTHNTQDGWTALHAASQEGHIDVVRGLLKANPHINQQSEVMSITWLRTHNMSASWLPLLTLLTS